MFVVSTKFAVIDVANFNSTLSRLFLSLKNSHKHSHVKISLETQQRNDVFAVPTCS